MHGRPSIQRSSLDNSWACYREAQEGHKSYLLFRQHMACSKWFACRPAHSRAPLVTALQPRHGSLTAPLKHLLVSARLLSRNLSPCPLASPILQQLLSFTAAAVTCSHAAPMQLPHSSHYFYAAHLSYFVCTAPTTSRSLLSLSLHLHSSRCPPAVPGVPVSSRTLLVHLQTLLPNCSHFSLMPLRPGPCTRLSAPMQHIPAAANPPP